MKKLFLLLFLAVLFLPACTSQDEDFGPIDIPNVSEQIDSPDGETEEDPEEDPIEPPLPPSGS